MGENGFTFLICKSPEEMKFAQEAEMAILEGLGSNILEHLGNVELGQPIRIYIQEYAGKVVGGVIANCFGGWMYISLPWVEKSLRDLGYGTRLLQLVESEAIQMGYTHAYVDTYASKPNPSMRSMGTRSSPP